MDLPYVVTDMLADHDAIAAWALDGVAAMRAAGIIMGYADGTFAPQNTATRAEAAAISARFVAATDDAE